MNITQSDFGNLPNGQNVTAYELVNANGTKVTIIDYGARLVGWEFRGLDVLLGYADAATYAKDNKFMGAVVGRFANRIDKGEFTLNGQMYQLDKNDGNNHLHGGYNGFYQKMWQAEILPDVLKLTVTSVDGESGYPGNFTGEVTYRLTDNNELIIDYAAESDADTLCNLTNHAYFNLNGHDSGDILGQRMQICADGFTWANAESIPDGTIKPVADTPMDLRQAQAIGAHIDDDFIELQYGKGYDHNWCVGRCGEMKTMAVAQGDKSGVRLTVSSDLPGVQFYSGNFLDADLPGKGGTRYAYRTGFCLETQFYPNSVNLPNFDQPILRRGEKWHSRTIFALA